MSENESSSVRVPGFVIVAVTGLAVGAIGGLFAFVVDTREDVVRLETDVQHVQRDNQTNAGAVAGIPAQLATLTSEMTQVRRELASITDKIDTKARR